MPFRFLNTHAYTSANVLNEHGIQNKKLRTQMDRWLLFWGPANKHATAY